MPTYLQYPKRWARGDVKNAIFVWYLKTQTMNKETTAAVITAMMSILSHASEGR